METHTNPPSRLSHQAEPGLWYRNRARQQRGAAWLSCPAHLEDWWQSACADCAWCDGSVGDVLLSEEGQGVQVWCVMNHGYHDL